LTRHNLVHVRDLDRLEGLNERYRQLTLRLEALTEEAAHYDRPVPGLRALQEEAVRVRREAVELLKRMTEELEKNP